MIYTRLSLVAILVCCGLTAAAALSADSTGGYHTKAEKNEFGTSDVGEINKNARTASFRIDVKTIRPSTKPTPRRAQAAKADASKYQVPGRKEMREMTRTALLDFNEAVEVGDFTDFYSKISKVWQKQVTAETFNEVFGEFITKKVDISEVGTNNPVYKPRSSVRRDKGLKKLIAEGCYDVNPRPVKFVLKWIPEGKEWKLFGIEVDTTVASC